MRVATLFSSVVLLVCLASVAVAGGTIRGVVKDAQTKDPLPYANMLIKGTGMGAVTDADGAFVILNIPAGKYVLRAGFVGYKTVEVEIEVKEGEIQKMNFSLPPESVEGQEVVVTAQALGQRHAINEQVTAATIKSVVSSAKIQELPDVNAAESVSRLPGVSLIRTGGEGSKVVVRGLSPQYNRVTIDGVELGGNTNSSNKNDYKTQFGENDELSTSGDRGSDLSMISSNMLGGIEVIKAITPDMDATVFGGVVNFSMRKAQKSENDAARFELIAQGNHNALKNTYHDYKFVGSYEQRFSDNAFGVFAQGTAERKNLSAQELGADMYFAPDINVNSRGVPTTRSYFLSDAERDRRRYGGTLVLDYAHETGTIGLMNFYSRSETHTVTRREDVMSQRNEMFYSANNSNTYLDTYNNLLSVKEQLGGVGIDLRLSHSFSLSENPDDVNFNFWQNGIGVENRKIELQYAAADYINKQVVRRPQNAQFLDISNINNLSKDRTYNGALDLTKEFVLLDLFTTTVKTGGSYNYKNRSYDYNQSSGSVFYDDGGQVRGAIGRAFPQFLADDSVITFKDFYDKNYSYGSFLEDQFTLGPPTDVDLMLRVIEVAKNNPGAGNGGGYKPQIMASRLYDYHGTEKRSAGYAMMTLNFADFIALMPGVRYQNLTTTYTGLRVKAQSATMDSAQATITRSHGYFLPMVHMQVKPTDWLKFHFAYTNTLNYADFNTIIPRYYIGPNFVLYNNSDLKPARSENFDLMMSVYSNEVGLFTIGGFKKRITDLVIPSKTYPDNFNAYPEIAQKVSKGTELLQLITYVNNPYKIDVIGLETEWQTNFWYLPGVLTGLVLNVNFTHIFSEATYPKTFVGTYLDTVEFIQKTYSVDTSYTTRLLDQPNDVVNISLGYDYAGFSIRAAMLYKDNVFKTPNFSVENWTNSRKYVRYDVSAKQELPWPGVQVYLNLNNLTGRDDVDINQVTGFVTSQQRYGMTADLGVRVKF